MSKIRLKINSFFCRSLLRPRSRSSPTSKKKLLPIIEPTTSSSTDSRRQIIYYSTSLSSYPNLSLTFWYPTEVNSKTVKKRPILLCQNNQNTVLPKLFQSKLWARPGRFSSSCPFNKTTELESSKLGRRSKHLVKAIQKGNSSFTGMKMSERLFLCHALSFEFKRGFDV